MVLLLGSFFGNICIHFALCISKSWIHFPHFWTRYVFRLPTVTCMFGLGQHAHAATRKVLIDKKAIGLNLLQNACFFNIKTDPEHKTLYRFYQSLFNYQVVPVSYNNTKSVRLIEYVVGERIVHLNEGAVKAVDFMHSNYHPYYKDLAAVSNGGDNIKYGPPKKSLPEWGTLDKRPELQPFINQISRSIKDMWGGKDFLKMSYETVFIFSELSGTRDNILQKAHVDLPPKIAMAEAKMFGAKSCIAFTTHQSRWDDDFSLD